MSIKCPVCHADLEVLTSVEIQVTKLSCHHYDSANRQHCNNEAKFLVRYTHEIEGVQQRIMCTEHAQSMIVNQSIVTVTQL